MPKAESFDASSEPEQNFPQELIRSNIEGEVIIIDGVSGAGKGTVAEILAEELGYHYISIGDIYRSITWALVQQIKLKDKKMRYINFLHKFLDFFELPNGNLFYGIDRKGSLFEDSLTSLSERRIFELLKINDVQSGQKRIQRKQRWLRKEVLEILDNVAVRLEPSEEGAQIYVGEQPVTLSMIKSEFISNSVPRLALYPEVSLKAFQIVRNFGEKQNIVIDGRNGGTDIFPETDVIKFFIDADVLKRAEWRHAQLKKKFGKEKEVPSVESIEKGLRDRDALDRNRDSYPLREAKSAIKIFAHDFAGPDHTANHMLGIIHMLQHNIPLELKSA